MNTNDLRKMSIPELRKELTNVLREQFNMRVQKASGQTIRPHLVKTARKEVARIKTIMREKEENKGTSDE